MPSLTVTKVRNAKPQRDDTGKAVTTRFSDGGGLHLLVKPSGAKAWVLRVQVDGKRRDIGLGAVDVDGAGHAAFAEGDDRLAQIPLMLRKVLTLAEAREKAAALRKLAKAGFDPVAERDRERMKMPTFAEAATEAYNVLSKGWADRTAKAFKASLEEHAVPRLGALRVDMIGSAEVIGALAPIWTDKPVMARKVRSRIGQVLAFAKARGWRKDALPDVRELRQGLSKQADGGHFKAMPYADCPAFFASQWELDLAAGRAGMLFAMLTGNRSEPVRKATWEQIDFEAREWNCPADIMKGKKVPHDVALSPAAIALLDRWQPDKALRTGLIFPGARGGPMSDMTLTKALRTAGRHETVHGFRSSFRSWAAEAMPHIPWNVAEMALAHKVGTTVEKSYTRAEYHAMRRALFDGWGRFVAPHLSGVTNNVTPIGATKQSA